MTEQEKPKRVPERRGRRLRFILQFDAPGDLANFLKWWGKDRSYGIKVDRSQNWASVALPISEWRLNEAGYYVPSVEPWVGGRFVLFKAIDYGAKIIVGPIESEGTVE
jgi:hypothetical protein